MSHYLLRVDGETTEHRVSGRSPAKALRELVSVAGLVLASQHGRYGRLEDGRFVMAATESWSRVTYQDARTTRLP